MQTHEARTCINCRVRSAASPSEKPPAPPREKRNEPSEVNPWGEEPSLNHEVLLDAHQIDRMLFDTLETE